MRGNRNENEEVVIDLREVFQILMKNAVAILLTGVIVAVGTWVVCSFIIHEQYTSTSKLYILPQVAILSGNNVQAGIDAGSSLATDYVELVKGRTVVEAVSNNLNLDMKYESLASKLTVSNPESTRIVQIVVTDEDPVKAKEIADEFAKVARDKISELMDTDKPSIVEHGAVAKTPTSPDVKTDTIIAFLVGILLAILWCILRYTMNDSIRSAENIDFYLEMNTLATIPLTTDAPKKRKKHRFKPRDIKRLMGKGINGVRGGHKDGR